MCRHTLETHTSGGTWGGRQEGTLEARVGGSTPRQQRTVCPRRQYAARKCQLTQLSRLPRALVEEGDVAAGGQALR